MKVRFSGMLTRVSPYAAQALISSVMSVAMTVSETLVKTKSPTP